MRPPRCSEVGNSLIPGIFQQRRVEDLPFACFVVIGSEPKTCSSARDIIDTSTMSGVCFLGRDGQNEFVGHARIQVADVARGVIF